MESECREGEIEEEDREEVRGAQTFSVYRAAAAGVLQSLRSQ